MLLTTAELDLMLGILVEHEGLVPWMYCDNRGFVTVGVGDKLTSDTAATMPFVDIGGNAVDGEAKRIAFARVQDAYQSCLTVTAYRACSDLRLPADFCKRRLDLRVKEEFLPAIERRCPNAASFPTGAKLVLVDIAYNVGVAGFGSFHSLIAACNAGQFGKAAENVHTKRCGEDPSDWLTWGRRNRWRRMMMLSAWQSTVTPVL